MLHLLDTGRMAQKFGKWRGLLYLVATAVPLAIANFIHKVFGILPGAPHPPAPLQWVEIGLYGLALFLWGCGCYRLYQDRVHHDYQLEAERYRREGW